MTGKWRFGWLIIFCFYMFWDAPKTSANNPGNSFFYKAEAAAHFGFVWPHDPDLDNLYTGFFPFFQGSISGSTDGSKSWHHWYNFPDLGFTFMFADLNYPEVLGRAFSVWPHISITLHQGRSVDLIFRYGAGIGYLDNWYREQENEENMAISTPINIAMNTALKAGVAVSENFSLKGGVSMTHFSNGRTRTPNKGLNIPSARVAFVYKLQPEPSLPERETNFEKPDKYSLSFYLSGGYSELYPPGGSKYLEFSLSQTLRRRLSVKTAIGVGADVFWGLSDKEVLNRKDRKPSGKLSLLKPGIHLSYEQVFSNTSFIVHQGLYLYARQDEDGRTYNRAGFRHYLGDRLQINLTIKSHLFRADFVEWGMGYRLF